MTQITINTETLTVDEVKRHLEATKEDFTPRDEQFISEYSKKLAQNAAFVVARGTDGEMYGLVAYYANLSPKAYITHVWVSNSYRGGGYCGRMLRCLHKSMQKRKFNSIRLEVRTDNESAINAYKKAGYSIISTDGRSHLMELLL